MKKEKDLSVAITTSLIKQSAQELYDSIDFTDYAIYKVNYCKDFGKVSNYDSELLAYLSLRIEEEFKNILNNS